MRNSHYSHNVDLEGTILIHYVFMKMYNINKFQVSDSKCAHLLSGIWKSARALFQFPSEINLSVSNLGLLIGTRLGKHMLCIGVVNITVVAARSYCS